MRIQDLEKHAQKLDIFFEALQALKKIYDQAVKVDKNFSNMVVEFKDNNPLGIFDEMTDRNDLLIATNRDELIKNKSSLTYLRLANEILTVLRRKMSDNVQKKLTRDSANRITRIHGVFQAYAYSKIFQIDNPNNIYPDLRLMEDLESDKPHSVNVRNRFRQALMDETGSIQETFQAIDAVVCLLHKVTDETY